MGILQRFSPNSQNIFVFTNIHANNIRLREKMQKQSIHDSMTHQNGFMIRFMNRVLSIHSLHTLLLRLHLKVFVMVLLFLLSSKKKTWLGDSMYH